MQAGCLPRSSVREESPLRFSNSRIAQLHQHACMLVGMGACQIRHSWVPSHRGERAKMEAWFPHFNIRMGCELGRTCMLIYMVALANAASSPIILPFALWWFIIAWIFWRYGILYVFERSTESGGMVRALLPKWRCVHPRSAQYVAFRDLHWLMLYNTARLMSLYKHAGALALHNPVYCKPYDDFGRMVRLAVPNIPEGPVLWNPFQACCQNHQEVCSAHQACTYHGNYGQSEGHEMLLQVWHQIFDKVNWCLFIFGIFTGKQTTLMLMEELLLLRCTIATLRQMLLLRPIHICIEFSGSNVLEHFLTLPFKQCAIELGALTWQCAGSAKHSRL